MTGQLGTQRVALVTGGAQGIGLAIARRLASDGAEVTILDRDPGPLERALEALRNEDLAVHGVVVDVREIESELPPSLRHLGRIDILVNNAGVAGSKAVADLDVERWAEVLDINLSAVFKLTRAVLPRMVVQGYGRIVNIASMNALQGFRANSDYSVSKAGLLALTRSVAADYGGHGVTCNAIAPGPIGTPLSERMLAGRPKWYVRGAVEAKPIRRMGRAEDVAAAAAFFASEESGFVTGQVLAVDGGLTACRFIPDAFSDEADT